MAYNIDLAEKLGAYLVEKEIAFEEKTMFGVLNFMVAGKTCVCVSGDNLMLRFDPALQESLSDRIGYETMYMKGREYKGYCYFTPEGFKSQSDFAYLIDICLHYSTFSKKTKKK